MQCLSHLKVNMTLHFNEFHLRMLCVKFVVGTGSVVLNKVFQNQCVVIFFIFISSCRNCYPLLLVPKFYTFKQGYFVQMKFGWKWFCRSRKHFQSCQWINFQYFANNLSFVKDMVITFNILNPLLPRKLFTTNDWICLMVLDLG